MNSIKSRALACLILGGITIGFGPIFIRLSEIGPIATGFWRVAIAFPILLLLSLQLKHSHHDTDELAPTIKDYLGMFFAGILFGGDLATWNTSIAYTTIANSTLLANFSPVLIALWGWLVLRKPPRKRLVIGLSLAIMGVTIMVNPSVHMAKKVWIGNGLALSTAFFYAGYLSILHRLRKKFTNFASMAISTFGSMLTLWVVTLASGETFFPSTAAGWAILITLGLFIHILGQGLIAYALPHLPVTFSATALLVQPVVAAMTGWCFFMERLSWMQMGGILIALLGIYLAKQEDELPSSQKIRTRLGFCSQFHKRRARDLEF